LRISSGTYIDIRTHLRVDEILAGACVALLFHRGLLKFRFQKWGFFVAFVFWFLASSEFAGPLQFLRPYSSAGLLAAVLVMGPGLVSYVLECRLARYIAEISYALYVIHPATTHGWMNEGSVWMRYFVKRPMSFALTLLLAHLSTFYWESRWIALGKRVTVSQNASA
jgi:peptidoglycan/LPS O-acetylase OafA/YrhL